MVRPVARGAERHFEERWKMVSTTITSILDVPADVPVDHDEFVRAAMQWHFDPDTGSPFWLAREATLGFDPRRDVHGTADLTLFPNVADELRDVRIEDLLPRGAGPEDRVVGLFESGGTTGAPKRVLCLSEWMDRATEFLAARLTAHGFPAGGHWCSLLPTGPHVIGAFADRAARALGGLPFSIDMDPRWVKKLVSAGRLDEVAAYTDHLVEQATFLLRTQDVRVLVATPPMLERIARDDALVDLVRSRIGAILWSGAHMDPDSRDLLRSEVFPGVALCGVYGSTTILGGTPERVGLGPDDPCVFDAFAPRVSYAVVDPATGVAVPYGERGQVVMNLVSRSMLLPNNLERDTALRVPAPEGHAGDSVADIAPVATFGGTAVVEGVY